MWQRFLSNTLKHIPYGYRVEDFVDSLDPFQHIPPFSDRQHFEMLWLLLRGLGYPFSSPYAGHGQFPKQVGIQDLDPINCAGQARIKLARADGMKSGFTVIVALLAILTSQEALANCFTAQDELRKGREIRFTNSKYRPHLEDLAKWRVLQEVTPEQVAFFATYFAVPKTPSSMRSIFNGRQLSGASAVPPPVNLADVATALKMMAELASRGRIYVCAGDFRHFFHQLPIEHGENARSMFGLAVNAGTKDRPEKKFFRYNVLPMGWSFSPCIAQAMGWMVIAGRRDSEKPLVNEDALKGNALPDNI